jgi:hypothetical protein
MRTGTDLSDEAFWEWSGVPESKRVLYAFLLEAWQEVRRRTEANRWAAFSPEELQDLYNDIGIRLSLRDEIKTEYERRTSGK